MVLLPRKTFSPGFVGMALSYGLSLNMFLIVAMNNQCTLSDNIISVERLNRYMNIPSEAPEVIEGNRPFPSWPAVGRVEVHELKGLLAHFKEDTRLGLLGELAAGSQL